MTDLKRKTLQPEQEIGRENTQKDIFYWRLQELHRKQLKQVFVFTELHLFA